MGEETAVELTRETVGSTGQASGGHLEVLRYLGDPERVRRKRTGRGKTLFGAGYHLDRPEKLLQVVVPDDHRKGHTWVFGTTRSGKTRLMEAMIEQDIRKGYDVLVIDPKGDIPLFSKIFQVAWASERLHQLMLFTPIFPRHSVELDPLRHFEMPEELVGHITSGVRTGNEPYFESVAYEISLIIVQALLLKANHQGVAPHFNLNDVRRFVPREGLERLMGDISYIQTEDAARLAETLRGILAKPADYFAKISSTLSVALNELTEGNIGQVMGRARQNAFIECLEKRRGAILVAQLGSMLTKRASYTAGKAILSTVQAYVGRRFASGEMLDPPLAVYIDEAQSVLYQGVEELFAKAGGANVWISGFCQSVNQLFAEITEERGRTILDNCNTKTFLRVSDADTALYVSEHLGDKEVFLPIIGMGMHNISLRDDIQERVRPTEILNLAPREFFLMTYTGAYRGKTVDVEPAKIEIVFPQVGAERDA